MTNERSPQTFPFRDPVVTLLVATWGAALAAGCGPDRAATEDLDGVSSEIIGGTAIPVSTRRFVGLVDVNNEARVPTVRCSGGLFNRDWVITATHCLDFFFPANNKFVVPRADGTTESRSAVAVQRVGASDISIAKLEPLGSGSQWPNVGWGMYGGDPAGLVGQNVSCYGRGATAYASPSGVTGSGTWKVVTRAVSSFSDGVLYMPATSTGTEVVAPGDSGGPCFVNNQIAGIASFSTDVCTDPTTADSCDATITKILNGGLRSTTQFKTYIDNAPSRTGDPVTFKAITLVNGWTGHPFGTNDPAAAVIDNAVHLRGAMATTGTNDLAFTLPFDLRPSANVYVPTTLCLSTKGRLLIAPTGNVSVQAEGGFGNAQCFTSLDGVSFTLDSGFGSPATPLTLQNGWTNAPFGTRAAAVRVANGIVRLQGAIAGGSTATPFTLPAGFRPAVTTYVPIDLCSAQKGRLLLLSDGTVTIQTFGAFNAAQCFTSLEGVSFNNDGGFGILALQNGWTPTVFGTRDPGVKLVNGIVRFAGAMANGTADLAFVLPPALRPATNVYVAVDMCLSQKGRLLIQPDGSVNVQTPTGAFAAAQCFTSFEGAWFGL